MLVWRERIPHLSQRAIQALLEIIVDDLAPPDLQVIVGMQ